MVKIFVNQKFNYNDTGNVDFAPIVNDLANIADAINDHAFDIDNILKRQTFTISYPIWNPGKYVVAYGGKHLRLQIMQAWVTLGDNNTTLDQTIQLFVSTGINDKNGNDSTPITTQLRFPNSYGAGSMLPLTILTNQDKIMFHRDIIVVAGTNRRCKVELLLQSNEPAKEEYYGRLP